MGIELRLLDSMGEQTAVLPDVESLSLSPILCDAGAIEFQYPADGINFHLIKDRDEFELAVYLDGVRQAQLDAMVKDVDGDDIAEDAVWKFTGFFNNGRLSEAVTFPAGWPTVDPEKPNLIFTEVSPGTLLGTLMQQAHQRGVLTDIDSSSFSGTHDSNGVPWDKQISLEFAPQVEYLDILKNLYEQRFCEFQVVGHSLRLYVADSMSEDLTLLDPPVVFRKGRDLKDSPRKRTTRDTITAFLAAGASGLFREVRDDAQIAARRRIEGGTSQGNVSDEGTLLAWAESELSIRSQAKMEKTVGLQFADEGTPRPIRHFNVGDWAWSDSGTDLERLRIKQWVLKTTRDGALEGSVVLNDLFAEREDAIARRVKGIIGGTTITGGSKAGSLVPENMVDGIPPSTPQGLSLSSAAYIDASGQTLAQMTASWQQVTTNADGTILEDLERYVVEWQQPEVGGSGWAKVDAGTANVVSWSPVAADTEIRVRVRAEDKAGNPSPWSDVEFTNTGADSTPPPIPSTPLVDNYLGLLRIRWDGQFLNDQARPFDFTRVEVHVSDINFFEPSDATRVGPLVAPGSVFVDVPYGEVRYARLVAYDATGNASDPSDIGQGTSSQVVGSDIFEGAVGSLQLADLAVVSAKIDYGAVNTLQVGSIDVGKISAGMIVAEWIMGGRIATAATGKRVEINGLGIFRWDENGNQTVAIDDLGALLTGQYRSARTGRRIVMGASSTSTGRIDFYSPDGDNGFVIAYTETTGVEAIQIGVRPPGVAWTNLWNKLNINSSSNGEYTSLRSGTLEFVYDAGANQQGSDGTTGIGRFVIYQTTNRGAGSSITRVQIDADETTFAGNVKVFWGFDNNGWLEQAPVGGSSSPMSRMFTPGGYGAGIRTFQDTRGTWVEIRAWNDASWYGIRAANFEVNSDRANKEGITEFSDLVLPDLRATKIKKYRRKGDDVPAPRRDREGKKIEGPGGETRTRPEEIGLIAQEAPARIVLGNPDEGLGIDLYQYVAFLHKGVQELADQIDDLKKGGQK